VRFRSASSAAALITPNEVKKVLEQFCTANVADLDQDQRREFIDLLDDAVDKAKE